MRRLSRVRASCRFFFRSIFELTILLIFRGNDDKFSIHSRVHIERTGSDSHRSAEYFLAVSSEQPIDKNFRRMGCGGFLMTVRLP